MEVIDEEGRLFGVVNVIDALVVLLVLAVVVAGIALVDPFATPEETDSAEPPETGTRYVTLDLGQQYPYVAEQIAEGDGMESANVPGSVAVTDVYVTPPGGKTDTDSSNVSVTVRLQIEGVRHGPPGKAGTEISFDGTRIDRGGSFTLDTDNYTATGTITAVDGTGESLRIDRTGVELESVVPVTIANSIVEGDTYTIAGREVARVESVNLYPVQNPERKRVVLGLQLATIDRDDEVLFGTSPVRLGSSVAFETNRYRFTGTVVDTALDGSPVESTSKTIVVQMSNVDPEIADGIEIGMTESGTDRTTARVVDKRVEPAAVILTSESGEIFQREHPRNVDVYLTVEVTVRDTRTGLRFHSRTLDEGTTVFLDFETITVEGTVTEITQGTTG